MILQTILPLLGCTDADVMLATVDVSVADVIISGRQEYTQYMKELKINKAAGSNGQIPLPPDLPKDIEAIGQEALRIHESAQYSSQSQFEQAKIWRTVNMWLGAPAAVLAALGGSAILSAREGEIVGIPTSVLGGVLALGAAALSAILTTINASRRQTQSQSAGNAFLQLQTASRQFATIDIQKHNYEDARDTLTSLTTSRDELNKTADVPSKVAFRRAQRNIIHSGGQDYAVDTED